MNSHLSRSAVSPRRNKTIDESLAIDFLACKLTQNRTEAKKEERVVEKVVKNTKSKKMRVSINVKAVDTIE